MSDFEGGFKFPGGIPRKNGMGGEEGGHYFMERNVTVLSHYFTK